MKGNNRLLNTNEGTTGPRYVRIEYEYHISIKDIIIFTSVAIR